MRTTKLTALTVAVIAIGTLGLQAQQAPITSSCDLLVGQILDTRFLVSSGNGFVETAIPVPPTLSLRGLPIHAQV